MVYPCRIGWKKIAELPICSQDPVPSSRLGYLASKKKGNLSNWESGRRHECSLCKKGSGVLCH